MSTLLRTGVLITLGILTTGVIQGCSVDDPIGHGEIHLVATVPENGGIIARTGDLKMFFDGIPKSVTVDGKPARIQGSTATVKISDLPYVGSGTEKTHTIEWRHPDNSGAGAETIRLTVIKRATTVVVDPPAGTVQQGGAAFTLRFDAEVLAVWLNDTPASGSGLNWEVWSVLPYGFLSLNIEWINQDGSAGAMEVGPYEVASGHNGAPVITDGTVADGETDVDPGAINAGGLRIDFDEDVTGTIKLTDEAGNDLNWTGHVAGSTATLAVIAGQELVNETIYKIEINVRDRSHNRTQVTITFVTKAK